MNEAIPAEPIPAELNESLREALAQALASGALQDTEAAALVTNFLVSGTVGGAVFTTPWSAATAGNDTFYWTLWTLYWWKLGDATNLAEQIPCLLRAIPPKAI